MWTTFKTAYFAGLGVLAAAATGLILWGLYDVAVNAWESVKWAWRMRKAEREAHFQAEPQAGPESL